MELDQLGEKMILPEFVLPSRASQHWKYSGQDHPDRCKDPHHFNAYPNTVEYVYNSRGFRDAEWPSDLNNAVWCIGDSFTVGVGSPVTHTWPYLLAQALNQQVINVSMDGASNQWIARKAVQLSQLTTPQAIVIHWSYVERREDPDTALNDEQRRLSHLPSEIGIIDCLLNFQQCVELVEQHKGSTQIIHSMIPRAAAVPQYQEVQQCWANIAGPDWPAQVPADINSIPDFVVDELKSHRAWEFVWEYYHAQELLQNTLSNVCYVGPTIQIDVARDGHHYDIKTAGQLVESICQSMGR